ncbi:PTS lactose/cellobiose transporter subunit IIA [Clostridium septicum]|uniref:PTS lactose/cellobiose transporter subunit IIA n=1 Tax=Clostridium septicum TaxID=1504 RepID=A0A9N7PL78_CLOSE|nr:PTS lactose/cellobiose transporter subunit IIA [Clostridium septicum]AYE35127.1 PTS lactose/cellobiose transporter subunit IIA [Clostridium septicum]MDU1314225.1 PTS lactose/cellobiose transporter subunit IIA [Clostridium septicum]QAS60519.1 PTS lactose/cellobiose transporter subunit IIA [Clostridium septicum]UEC20222.1 PTS lactose/cellobiose transporter subunit IIA [Clostridium septicum]USS01724.1 PTS lactose/cellobiose transporter subunit IIA [Clostridium septicum]
MNLEEIIMQIIISGGDSKSYVMEAIEEARNRNIEKARELIKKADTQLRNAHSIQTELIQNEARGEKITVELLMVHAQDHLMNAITVRDLGEQLVNMYEMFLKEC